MSAVGDPPDPASIGSGTTIRAKFRPSRALMAAAKAQTTAPASRVRRTRTDRLARQLALAHWIERAVEAGQIACYADVARALGLTQSRITQITALLGLSPALQERTLLGGGLPTRAALRAARDVDWERQGRTGRMRPSLRLKEPTTLGVDGLEAASRRRRSTKTAPWTTSS